MVITNKNNDSVLEYISNTKYRAGIHFLNLITFINLDRYVLFINISGILLSSEVVSKSLELIKDMSTDK